MIIGPNGALRRQLSLAISTLAVALSLATLCGTLGWSADGGFEVDRIPANDGSGRTLLVHLLRPPGPGPFPLIVVNHGSPPSAAKRPEMQVPKFSRLSQWLVSLGYVVALPLRRGYGAVGGSWDEGYGRCDRPDFKRAGLETARDIQAVLDAMTQRDYVRPKGIVVIGQSAGGWGTLALASRNPASVAGYVNFAGGRGGHRRDVPNDNCAPDQLVEAAAEFGKTTRRPSLWIYTENDSYFAPQLSRQMHSRYVSAGGPATLHMLPAVGTDGHQAISNDHAFALWSPVVKRFLDSLK